MKLSLSPELIAALGAIAVTIGMITLLILALN